MDEQGRPTAWGRTRGVANSSNSFLNFLQNLAEDFIATTGFWLFLFSEFVKEILLRRFDLASDLVSHCGFETCQ